MVVTKEMTPSVALFYLNTGSGHFSPAKTLANELNKMGHRAILIDGLSNSPNYARFIIEKGYRAAITRAIWVFELLYLMIYIKPLRELVLSLASRFTKPYIKSQLRELEPDRVIILHHFIIKPVKESIDELGLNIVPTVIVTDPFTAPRTWFKYKNLNYITFSDRVALKKSISYSKKPFIVDDKFINKDQSKDGAKVTLGLDRDRPTLLFLGGGDGLPGGVKILKRFLKMKLDINIVFICGRNLIQYKKVKHFKERNSNLRVEGFVNNVELYLKASDIVITKAGASTIHEILCSSTIPIITRYIWKQEKGNKDYITKNSLGFYEPKPVKVCRIVSNLLSSGEHYSSIINNINSLKINSGTREICRELVSC